METNYEQIFNEIKKIDTKNLNDDADKKAQTNIVEEQKIYFWIRLFIKEEENKQVEKGDKIFITWKPTGEQLETQFLTYGKVGLDKNHEDEINEYVNEEDPKILCLMVDINKVNNNDDIPFIRTLFKSGNHYEYQLMKRNQLLFLHKDEAIDYYDCEF